ncbi:MAG: phage tail protein [Bacteroidota bacterium]
MKYKITLLILIAVTKGFSQNVGIGTASPFSKLHVAGAIRSDTLIGVGVRNLFASPNGRIYDSLVVPSTLNWEITGNSNITALNFLGTTNANDVIFKTNNIERARILSTGNFGIGTTTPSQLLHVNGNALANEFWIFSGAGDLKIHNASTANTMVFNTSGLERMRIDNNGLVGINTAAPGTRLEVGAIGGDGITIKATTGVDVGDFIFVDAAGVEKARVYSNPLAASGLILSGSSIPGSHVFIDNAGNVGVGNSSPANRLHITSAAANTSGLRFSNLTSASPTVASTGKALSVDVNGDVVLIPAVAAAPAWELLGNAGTTAGTNFLGTTDGQDLVFKTNNSERVRVMAVNGNVGVGTPSPDPSAKVDIASTTSGFVMPRMTSVQRKAISIPVAGLQVYDTDLKGFYVYDGVKWDCANNPAGTVQYFANTLAPNGYLECNGQAVNRVTYAELFSAIGTLYGPGDGVTTFNLPDLRGEFLRGADNGRGADPGRTLGTTQSPSPVVHDDTGGAPAQNGDFSMDNGAVAYCDPWPGNVAGGIPSAYWAASPAGWTVYSGTSTGGAAYGMIHGSRPRNVALMPCIKF